MRYAILAIFLFTLGLSPAPAETVLLDAMETRQEAWGASASVEGRLVKEGKAALRWVMVKGPLERRGLPVDLARYHSLRLWLHSPEESFARVRMQVLDGEGKPLAQLQFKVDWDGWSRMELPAQRFRPVESGKAIDWSAARGLRMECLEKGFVEADLVLDGLEVSTDWPQIPVSDHETLIDWPYFGGETVPWWKPSAETQRRPGGTYGYETFWSWGNLWVRENAAARDVCAYTREFGADLSGYGTLEVRISNDANGFLSVHTQVDGRWSTPVRYLKGTGHFTEVQIPLPEGAKRLDAVTFDLSEPEDALGGANGRDLKCSVQWLLLRKRGASIGSPATGREPFAPIPLQGSLEKDGFAGGVYFGKEEIPRIRELLLRGTGKSVGERVVKRADAYLDTVPEKWAGEYFPERNWVATRSTDPRFALGDAAYATALAYVLTGEKRYADMARRCLLTACRIKHWSGGYFTRYPQGWGGHGNPFSESSYTQQLGLAYDWAYTALAPAERTQVEDALIRKGVRWTYDLLSHSSGVRKMNQGVVFGSDIGVGLLAMEARRPECRALREQTAKWVLEAVADYSLQDGESTEGVGYWHYTWNVAVRLLAALGRRDPEGLAQQIPEKVRLSMDWLAHMKSNASGNCLFFSDATGGPPSPAVSAFFARYLGSETGAWFRSKHTGPSDELSAFLWEGGVPAKEPRLLLARHFRGAGYLIFREGFDVGDTLVSLIGGPWGVGHNQNDRCSFTLEAFGEPLAMDPGMLSYENPIHRAMAYTRLHNTITLDRADTGGAAKTKAFFSSPFLDYAEVDGTGAYQDCHGYTRRILYLRPDVLVVLDDILLSKPRRVEWNLNSCGEVSLSGSRVIARAKASSLVVDFAEPRALTMETEVWPCGHAGYENHHAALSTGTAPALAQRFLAVLRPTRDDPEAMPPVKPLEVADGYGFEFPRGDERLVVLGGNGGTVKAAGIELEGDLAILSYRGAEVRSAALLGGTHLVVNGHAVIAARVRGNYSLAHREGFAAAALQGAHGSRVGLPSSASAYLARGGASIGGMQGEFQPITSMLAMGGGPSITIPAGDAPLGGFWALLGKPEWLDPGEAKTPQLTSLLADGKPLPDGVLPEDTVPEEIALAFRSGSNPIDPRSVAVWFDGKRIEGGDAVRVEVDDRAGTGIVRVRLHSLLPESERKPKRLTMHTVEARARDRGLLGRTAWGRARLTLRPHIPLNGLFLSDLAPVSAMAHGGLIRDRAYAAGAITLAGVEYPKGLTMHPAAQAAGSYAEAIYDVRAHQEKRFRAYVGMQTGRSGSVVFTLFTRKGDGPWQERFRTETMDTSSAPREVDLPLTGADQIRLYVTDAGDGIASDHAVWAMARME